MAIATAGLGAFAGLAADAEPTIFLAFLSFVIVSELLEVRLSNGATSSLGLAPAFAYLLLGNPVAEAAICFTAGSLAAAAIRRLWNAPPPGAVAHAIPVLVLLAAGFAFQGAARLQPDPAFGHAATWIPMLAFGIALAVIVGGGEILRAADEGYRRRIPWWPLYRASVRAAGPIHLSTASTGTLLALAYPILAGWSLPLFLAPLLATHYSFRQLASTQRTYLQTVRALSRVPEMAGYTRTGHSKRVAELAVAIAQELGISETSEIEYAALLHDIGRLSLTDADPDIPSAGHPELAAVGAAIIEKTGHFPAVAHMIRHQNDPYRRRSEEPTDRVPLGARIIKTASAYDDLTRPGGLGRTPWDAVERLSLATTYDHDPSVLQALVRVLEKRGEV